MRGLIQRVTNASVSVDRKIIGEIEQGILLFLAVQKQDDDNSIEKLCHKILNYRIFSDDQGKMNRSLLDIRGGILVVSQFTLAADTRKGLRPGFSTAAPPDLAELCYDKFVSRLKSEESAGIQVATGSFAADMQVSLLNDGPVTFMLEVSAGE